MNINTFQPCFNGYFFHTLIYSTIYTDVELRPAFDKQGMTTIAIIFLTQRILPAATFSVAAAVVVIFESLHLLSKQENMSECCSRGPF